MLLGEWNDRDASYPVVVIGSGMGSLFFLHRLLEREPETQVLVLERGAYRPWDQQLSEERNSHIANSETFASTGVPKPWNFTIAFGGGTNCWYASTPRLLPSDFRVRSLYGRSRDWPISYDTLEPYYGLAEKIMDVAGPEDISRIAPRSTPYPQPPHKFSAVDRLMKTAQPDHHFSIPTARARVANAQRPACCASFRCRLCPVQAKFTALNGFGQILAHPNIHILTDAEVLELERGSATTVRSVRFRRLGTEFRVRADMCVLGANAIHSPAILLRSGLDAGSVGRGLNEQIGYAVEVMLDGLDNLDGSTISTGGNYSLYDGAFRAEHAGTYFVFDNRFPYGVRTEFGRWRQLLSIAATIENEPNDGNRVVIDGDGRPVVEFHGDSSSAEGAFDASLERLPDVLSPLPVEKIVFKARRETESHLQGSLRMGRDPDDSVVDAGLVHHQIRNLWVVGTSVLPSCPPVAPSLTAAALSLRAADLCAQIA